MTASNEPKLLTASHNVAPSFPKIVVFDMTARGDGTATGEIKDNLFAEWPDLNILQFYRRGDGIGSSESHGAMSAPAVWDRVRQYRPDTILYRPVPDAPILHGAAMETIRLLPDVRLVTWIMDDWPARLEAENPEAFANLNADLRWLLRRSSVRLSISDRMSAVFAMRYGLDFVPLANGVDPAEWQGNKPAAGNEFIIRYAGSLADNMTAASVLKAAVAVESLAQEGHNIRLEIRTRPAWKKLQQVHYADLERVSFITTTLSPVAYREWLQGADATLIGYNFDPASIRYVGLSMANKLPECLASGAPLLAFGPANSATISYLREMNCAVVVDRDDGLMLKQAIRRLVTDPAYYRRLSDRGRRVAFERHNIVQLRRRFREILGGRVEGIERQAVISGSMVDTPRAEKVTVDETEVVGRMLSGRKGASHVMLDVGAHFGTSAAYFHELGWTIHCFEPDAANREKLVAKFGRSANVIIDPRAVSDKAASGVSFFKSDESTGISGLHAFRDTHREAGQVDVTTVAEIVQSRKIAHVDFLKIDVEGFDFSVIKGVPWDRLQPDVIECEFEDLKTIPLGHTWKDVAQFLLDKGYAVYLSEWHPIIRYGISHDWRRVVAYPTDGVPSDAWGNILAFRQDPGIEAVTRAFDAVIARARARARVSEGRSPTVAQRASEPAKAMPTAVSKRPGKRNSSKTPSKKSGANVRKQKSNKPVQKSKLPAGAGRKVANALRRRSSTLFRVAQVGAWIGRAAWRRKAATLLVALICAILVALPFVSAPLWDWRYGFWLIAAAIPSLGAAAVVLRQALRRISRRHSNELKKVRKGADRRINQLKRRLMTEEAKRRIAVGGMRKDLASKMAQNTLGASRSLDAIRSNVASVEGALNRRLEQRSQEVASNLAITVAEKIGAVGEKVGAVEQKIGAVEERLDTRVDRIVRRSNYSNVLRVHDRYLTESDLDELSNTWLKTLGLNIPKSQLRYMAHQICMAEERSEGRMATTIQAAMLRTLALLSLQEKTIDVLEIGTLFGIATGSLYKTAARAGRNVTLTLLDPLEGYYDQGLTDAQTGVQVTRTTVVGNLAAMGVPTENYRIIQRRSTDSEAVKEASDRQYDYLLIDGDHSLEGVAADFDLYGSMVKPGGVLIFDDYDTTDWPAIKPYVDEQIRPNPDWLWIGGGWRTAIFRRRRA